MNMQMIELMSSPHNFPCILFNTEMTKIPYFSYMYEKVKLAYIHSEYMQNNVCSDIFWYRDMLLHVWATTTKMKIFKILYTQYMENSYWLFKKCFVENYENSKFHIFLIFYPIYIKFSLFYSKCFTLSIDLT